MAASSSSSRARETAVTPNEESRLSIHCGLRRPLVRPNWQTPTLDERLGPLLFCSEVAQSPPPEFADATRKRPSNHGSSKSASRLLRHRSSPSHSSWRFSVRRTRELKPRIKARSNTSAGRRRRGQERSQRCEGQRARGESRSRSRSEKSQTSKGAQRGLSRIDPPYGRTAPPTPPQHAQGINESPPGAIVPWLMPPTLIIRQTPETHDEIDSFLGLLRK